MSFKNGHLRYFVTIADEGQITSAARKLHLAQPALSQAMAQLESDVGFQLLARHSRGVTLTPAGAAFLIKARATVSAWSDAKATARSIARAQRHDRFRVRGGAAGARQSRASRRVRPGPSGDRPVLPRAAVSFARDQLVAGSRRPGRVSPAAARSERAGAGSTWRTTCRAGAGATSARGGTAPVRERKCGLPAGRRPRGHDRRVRCVPAQWRAWSTDRLAHAPGARVQPTDSK
jgi:hypothetical protein